jgi:hypothetical protein
MSNVQTFQENLSDRQRRLLAVMRSGKRAELDDLVDRVARSAKANYAEVLGDNSRTAEWKAEQLDDRYKAALASFDTQLERMAGPVVDTYHRDYAAVFGTDGVPGDAASLAISRRDAGDRVASVHSTSDLFDLLERADLSGDEILARAVAQKAYENGDAKVINRFLESRPALDEAVTRLWKRRRNHDHEVEEVFRFSMKLATIKPGATGFHVR